jgi:hypothetical protein
MARAKRVFFCKSGDGSITYTTDGNFLYAEKDGALLRLDLFAGRYYKLRPFNGVPVLEIDGLRMQLVRDFRTPLDYAKEVVAGLKIPKSGKFIALDTCMGLGYTAIELSRNKAVDMVVTCEISDAVITLAQWNHFSEPVFAKDGKIVLLRGNVSEQMRSFQSGMFDFVIHDPPRLSHAPELYSKVFYSELYRVCKKGARIFHYVGSLGKGRGRNIGKEVEMRLGEAGFRNIRHSPRLQGLYAEK